MWFVYVLLCQDKSLYTGISTDPKARFLAHKSGKGGKYTKSHKVLKLLYSEQVANKSSALKRELEIKSWPRAKKIQQLHLSKSIL